MAVGDIDRDGKPDLVVGSVVWRNSGGGRFVKAQTLGLGDLPTALLLVDVDADGDLDLLANRGSRQTGRTELLLFENTTSLVRSTSVSRTTTSRSPDSSTARSAGRGTPFLSRLLRPEGREGHDDVFWVDAG